MGYNTPPEIRLMLKKDGKIVRTIPMNELFGEIGGTLAISITRDNETLVAEINNDKNFPAIDIEAVDSRGNNLVIASAELPNEDYETQICSRLYAGYVDQFEAQDPIARVVTDIRDKDKFNRYQTYADKNGDILSRKTVYIDYEGATAIDENIPSDKWIEHEEDIRSR